MMIKTERSTRAHKGQSGARYLVSARPNQGVISQITANIGRDDLSVDAIPRDEIFVLPGVRRWSLWRRSHLRRLCRGSGSSRHYEVAWGEGGVGTGEEKE